MRSTFTILFICVSTILFAQEKKIFEKTHSEYIEGRFFHTYSTYFVNAPISETDKIFTEILEGFKTSPVKDLSWAFEGLGDVGAKEDVLMYERSVTFDKNTSKYVLDLLVVMNNDKEMVVEVEGELKNAIHATGKREITLKVTKKVKILNEGIICITAIPHINNTTVIILHSKLRFGWIFDMFFTQNRYKNILEWRFDGFLKNVKNRVETQNSLTAERK